MSPPSPAGASSPSSPSAQPSPVLGSPPPSPARLRPAAEPYDSPLKPLETVIELGYAAGGRETDAAEDDDGDLGRGMSAPPLRRDKGKGRANDEYGRVAADEEEHEADAGQDEVDEEAEARRIQENLAKWSRAEAKKRADARKSVHLVYPSLPSPPPVPIPSASTLIRRTSTLIRSASKRRGSGAEVGGLEADEMELEGTGAGAGQGNDGVSGRRGRRKLSLVIDSGRDGPAAPSTGLPQVGEEEEDPSRTPTATHFTPLSASQAASHLSSPPHDPFSPSNASFVSLASTVTSSDRAARTGSRFIEDLPPLPLSPPSDRTSNYNPFMTPTTPTHAASLPFSSSAQGATTSPPGFAAHAPHPAAPTVAQHNNPFTDVVVISPPTSPPRPSGSTAPSTSSHTLAPSASHTSLASFASTSTATTTAAAAPVLAHASSPPGLPLPVTASTTSEPRRRRSPRSTPSPSRSPSFDGGSPRRAGAEQEERDDDSVGLLDWLMCGCWRVSDGQRAQQGRTNPNE
ncbi:hypothetical protein JCM10207_006482 [Rhodosporidiobolus poonsookiae]